MAIVHSNIDKELGKNILFMDYFSFANGHVMSASVQFR